MTAIIFDTNIQYPHLKHYPQAAGVDRREKGAVVRGAHTAEERAHLFDGEHRGQAALALGADEIERVPVAAQHMDEEEANAAIADAQGTGRPAILVLAV